MSGISEKHLIVGKKYCIVNYGETRHFMVLDKLFGDYLIQDVLTMEKHYFHEFIQYGKGNDFHISE